MRRCEVYPRHFIRFALAGILIVIMTLSTLSNPQYEDESLSTIVFLSIPNTYKISSDNGIHFTRSLKR